HQTTAFGTAVHRDELTNGVPVSDPRFRCFALVLLVLRSHADRTVRIKGIVLADRQLAFHIDMGQQTSARPDGHAGANDAVRSDFSLWGYFGAWVDNCGRVNCHPSSNYLNWNSAPTAALAFHRREK